MAVPPLGTEASAAGTGPGGRKVVAMPVLLALVVLVIVEVAAVIAVAQQIGAFEAIGLLVLVSLCGPWLVRRAGFGVWRRAQARVIGGQSLDQEARDGLLLLGAGLLICVPGFVTDVFGILLLLPPVRALVRRRINRRAALGLVARFGGPGAGGGRWRGGRVLDADSHPYDVPEEHRSPGERPLGQGGEWPHHEQGGGAGR